MICHWDKKTLIFEHEGRTVTLVGMDVPSSDKLDNFSMAELQSWLHNNEVWAMAMVDPVSGQPDNGST
jgi:kynurenine formamidase